MNKYRILLIIFILFVGAFLRFYKLDWGEGIYSHPDEYHIVSSVAQLSFPKQMHPHFFSYGTVTIYLIYFTQEAVKYTSSIFNFQFPALPAGGLIFNSFLVGRFYSALFSTLTIFLVYKICESFMRRRFALLAALLTALTPGLIQQAHFATPESALTFFLFLSLLFLIKFAKSDKFLYLILSSVSLGFALGVKISSIVFLLPLTAAIVSGAFPKSTSEESKSLLRHLRGDRNGLLGGDVLKKAKVILKTLLKFIILVLISMGVTAAVFALVAPYVFLDFQAFKGNFDYEGSIATGTYLAFYIRQFANTVPVLFQFEKILPYALGPGLLIFATLGFILIIVSFKKPKVEPIIVAVAFLSLFVSNAFLFAKWTRFIAPTFPFFAIFCAFFLERVEKINQKLSYILVAVVLIPTILWTLAFFSIYLKQDVRWTASKWLQKTAPANSTFMIEGGNMVDIPLEGDFKRIGFDFYALEEDPLTRQKIVEGFLASDYFLVQSRRIFMNHQKLPKLFPKTANLYDKLFDGELGFAQIKEFHSYPTLSFLGLSVEFSDETAEETWSVFDHPVIRIFKKVKPLTKETYTKVFEN